MRIGCNGRVAYCDPANEPRQLPREIDARCDITQSDPTSPTLMRSITSIGPPSPVRSTLTIVKVGNPSRGYGRAWRVRLILSLRDRAEAPYG